MPQPQRNQFAEDDSDFESNSHANEDSTDSDSTDSDEDLVEIRAAIAPARDGATIQEVRQALEMAQNLLLNMRGKCRELLKRNALLEATTAKGRRGKNLTAKDLALSAKEDTIRAHGRKYSMTHCLWINAGIFPLRVPPNIELFGSERWLSPQSIEDGVKAELFKFIPEIDHELMGYKNFAPHFAKGVSGIRSEMVSDIKSCAGAIFRLKSEFFVRGYPRDTQPECRTLLVNPHGEYTKFAPVLFLHPERPNKDEFLKTAKLVRVLKVALFGKSSLSATYAPAPKTKGKLWQLRNTTPGMIAAAAVVAIFVLSGDKDLYAKGEKSNILYQQYHNYYRQRLMTGGAWARDITNFFNNALFPETSSSHAALDVADTGTSYNSWEEELERAMEEGGEGPAFPFDTAIIAPQDIAQSSSAAYPPSASAAHPPSALVACPSASVALPASTPVTTPDTLPPVSATAPVILHSPTPIIGAQTHSISSAMQDLALADEAIAVGAIPPKPKPKPRRTKAKAVQDETGAEVRRSGRKK
ncbi:uncharacterized protein F5891DRAFT_1202031 [Suillus fuscotomentosus]|uniref:Uncharacterized protein n=1 Tax=Suillus fuscotomentosus TaxID=1912939 RepID=A0AAD4HBT4_9AGAM|nr:uncharacterized protein F5891DRAFT_1202031 [Suillus fuscotomentosus]KAG1885302.1 hypothetical protein F5891DRAFT_1202031 [Suillus fuscotomentosus]